MSRKILYRFTRYLFAGLLLITFISYGERNDTTPQSHRADGMEDSGLSQVIQSVESSNTLTFAGEKVPLDRRDVRERLEKELTINSYWHSSTLLNLKRASRYFPLMEKILKEEGVPEDFKYLAVAESNLENATSPAGAKGMWQFMPSTARAYDLEISVDVEERYNVEKATRAACRYLKDYYKTFESWTLAAAAYNMGGPRLNRVLTNQKETSYYDLNLNAETARYLFRILAFKEILTQAESFGFYLDEEERYKALIDYREITVDSTISSLGDFAHQFDISYRELKRFNPWLTSHRLTNEEGKAYEIRIPDSVR